MNPDFVKKLNLRICDTKIGIQKIDISKLDNFSMVIASVLMKDKKEKSHFFDETFWFANISIDIILDMCFFTLSNIEIDVIGCYIHWKSYTITKVLWKTRQIDLIWKKKFTTTIFNLEDKIFIVHVAFISLDSMSTLLGELQ